MMHATEVWRTAHWHQVVKAASASSSLLRATSAAIIATHPEITWTYVAANFEGNNEAMFDVGGAYRRNM